MAERGNVKDQKNKMMGREVKSVGVGVGGREGGKLPPLDGEIADGRQGKGRTRSTGSAKGLHVNKKGEKEEMMVKTKNRVLSSQWRIFFYTWSSKQTFGET